jgi:hypothetical protein
LVIVIYLSSVGTVHAPKGMGGICLAFLLLGESVQSLAHLGQLTVNWTVWGWNTLEMTADFYRLGKTPHPVSPTVDKVLRIAIK